MNARNRGLVRFVSFLVLITLLFSSTLVFSATPAAAQDGSNPEQAPEQIGQETQDVNAMMAQAASPEGLSVIVVLKQPAVSTSKGLAAEQSVIATSQDQLIATMAGYKISKPYRYQNMPLMAMKVDAAALSALLKSPVVEFVQENTKNSVSLADSTKIVGATEAWAAGYSGSGVTVAIVDTGVDKTHTFLAGKVVGEGCFSGVGGMYYDVSTTCPGGVYQSTASGSGVPCSSAETCGHGTHVAGISAGNGGSTYTFSGVAKDATILAYNVFSYYAGDYYTWDSDYIKALDRIYYLASTHTFNISSVNMSLGGGGYSRYCDSTRSAVKKAIDKLRTVNVATIIASGNDGYTKYISAPGCISTAVSVGAVDKQDSVADFSNSASFLSLLAPGVAINSSLPGNNFAAWDGTSMATPHVTGAWAILRQAFPTKKVTDILSMLKTTGVTVRDWRNGIKKPRISISGALGKYTTPSAAPTLNTPNDYENLTDSTPIFSWNAVPLASKYVVVAKKGTVTKLNKTVTAASVCDYSTSVCTYHTPVILANGSYTWSVKPMSMKGAGPVSATRTFITPSSLPAGITVSYPVGNYSAFSGIDGYYWSETAAPGVTADRYKLELFLGTKKLVTKTYDAVNICNQGGDCWIPYNNFSYYGPGTYTWKLTQWNPLGWGTPYVMTYTFTYPTSFDSQFNGDATGWNVRYPGSPSDGGSWYINSTDLYTNYGWNYTWASASFDAFFNNLDYTANLKRDGNNPNYSNGIMIRANPTKLNYYDEEWYSGYMFVYTINGSCSAWKISNGRETNLMRWKYCPSVYTGTSSYNQLEVKMVGSSIRWYINGTLVLSKTDGTLKSGAVGVVSYVPEWSSDHFYVDYATLNTITSLSALDAASLDMVGSEAADIGSPAGPNITLDQYHAMMNQQKSGPTDAEKLAADQAAGLEIGQPIK